MSTVRMINVGVLGCALLLNLGCATGGSKVWEKTNCEDHVEKSVANDAEHRSAVERPQRTERLLASCEQQKRERAQKRRLRLLEAQMFRNERR